MSFDIQTYRANENLAKEHLPNWQTARKHNLSLFEKVDFPVRLNSMPQVRMLLDTNQEGRFDSYMQEVGGFNEQDLELFIAVCENAIRFQATHFSQERIILPLDTIMSAFVIYIKGNKLKPNFKSILELGPGCGYLTFFLKSHSALERYFQVEACESFYMLQHLHNQFVFSEQFDQRAHIAKNIHTNLFSPPLPEGYVGTESDCIEVDNPFATSKKCCHFPWWKIGELSNLKQEFDLITSNANLLEFSSQALSDYLVLIENKLSKKGFFFVQCFGWGENNPIENLWKKLYDFGFSPLFIADRLFVDMNELLLKIPAEVGRIFLAPAGNAIRLLTQNQTFLNRFKEIVLVDNLKAGQCFENIRIISPKEIEGKNIKHALVLHWNDTLVEGFTNYFTDSGIMVDTPSSLGNICKKFTVPNGVFVTEGHKLFQENYDLSKFSTNSDSLKLESIVKTFFDDSENKTIYTKHDLVKKITKHYNRPI